MIKFTPYRTLLRKQKMRRVDFEVSDNNLSLIGNSDRGLFRDKLQNYEQQ